MCLLTQLDTDLLAVQVFLLPIVSMLTHIWEKIKIILKMYQAFCKYPICRVIKESAIKNDNSVKEAPVFCRSLLYSLNKGKGEGGRGSTKTPYFVTFYNVL